MRILVLNPNATKSMTDIIARVARRSAAPGTEISATTGQNAPLSVEGHADAAFAAPSLLTTIRDAIPAPDAFVIACFDDPGLHAAREVAEGPVIGIAQAAMQMAMILAARFSIITTLPRSVPVIEDLVQKYGATHACRRVRAINLPVLALEAEPDAARRMLLAEILLARDEDGAEAIVLGCAGMAEMCDWLSGQAGLPVIDGVVAAIKFAEAIVGAGYRTSKSGSYAYPRNKSADGKA